MASNALTVAPVLNNDLPHDNTEAHRRLNSTVNHSSTMITTMDMATMITTVGEVTGRIMEDNTRIQAMRAVHHLRVIMDLVQEEVDDQCLVEVRCNGRQLLMDIVAVPIREAAWLRDQDGACLLAPAEEAVCALVLTLQTQIQQVSASTTRWLRIPC